jgi:hypothetical protein
MAAFVSWQESGSAKRTQIFRHSPELFSHFEAAEKALENAKSWINGSSRSTQPRHVYHFDKALALKITVPKGCYGEICPQHRAI